MRAVLISDTHTQHRKLTMPEADMLICAGDFLLRGTLEELIDFNDWLAGLTYQYKIVIAGNHELIFESQNMLARETLTSAIYLENSGIEIEGIKIWGSPITPRFHNWAFNRDRGQDIARYWEMIPEDTDVLITHGPPSGILDKNTHGDHTGCKDLLARIIQINPQYHIFGHIHESYGRSRIHKTHFINCSVLNRNYQLQNTPVIIDIL